MIIVSQDRKRIVENLNLGIRGAGEYNKNYTIYNAETGENLGEYATEERAKEVLREICDEYLKYGSVENGFGSVRQIVLIPKVYEMPEN